MGKTRGKLYKAARILGDIEAVQKGRVGKRIQRRAVGKMTGRALGKSGCFVATACYGTPMAEEVIVLSRFRDRYLERWLPTKAAVRVYYAISPPIAALIRESRILRAALRFPLRLLVRVAETFCCGDSE